MTNRNGVHQRVRVQNERAALRLLMDEGPLSRQEIAESLALSHNTLSPFLARALKSGALRLATTIPDRLDQRRGPNPEIFELNPAEGVVIGIDLGYDYARARVAHLDGKPYDLHEKFGVQLPEMGPYMGEAVHERPTETLQTVARWIEELIEAAGQPPSHVAGIGIGVAAPVGPDRASDDAQLRDARAMDPWRTVPIKSQLRQYLGWPDVPIHVDNDATLGLLAEMHWGAVAPIDQSPDVLFVKWTTGIGMGLAFGGRIYRGAGNIAGEFGHAPITVTASDAERQEALTKAGGPTAEIAWPAACTRGCPTRCLESVAGRYAIVADYRRRARHADPIELDEIMAMARGGDIEAREAIGQASRYLGEALVPLLNTLNPSRLVIGGTLGGMRNFALYNDEITAVVRDRALMAIAADYRLTAGAIEGATVLGAVALAMQHETVPYLERRIRAVGDPD